MVRGWLLLGIVVGVLGVKLGPFLFDYGAEGVSADGIVCVCVWSRALALLV